MLVYIIVCAASGVLLVGAGVLLSKRKLFNLLNIPHKEKVENPEECCVAFGRAVVLFGVVLLINGFLGYIFGEKHVAMSAVLLLVCTAAVTAYLFALIKKFTGSYY